MLSIQDLYKFIDQANCEVDLLKLGYLSHMLELPKRSLKAYAQKVNADVVYSLQERKALCERFPTFGENYKAYMKGIVQFTDECSILLKNISPVEKTYLKEYIKLQAKHIKTLERK